MEITGSSIDVGENLITSIFRYHLRDGLAGHFG